MAVEAKRGCGYRKVGGLYLVGGGAGVACDRLPIELTVCPCCHAGFKQTRGWTWIDVSMLIGGVHPECEDDFPCPLCMATSEMGKAGLLWIGEKFYPTPEHFDREGAALGISLRISAIPRNFKVGETWVLLAHPKTVQHKDLCECGADNKCTLFSELTTAGIFKVWRHSAIERICKESDRGSDMVEDLVKRGITPVFVPDDDKDHWGSAYDKEDAEEEVEA